NHAVQDFCRRDLEDRPQGRNKLPRSRRLWHRDDHQGDHDQLRGSYCGCLAAGLNGIIVNAGAADKVMLRGLDINGFGTGINGIRFLAGQALLVENCLIYEFSTNGIDITLATNSSLTVKNTIITDVAGAAIRFNGGGGVPALSIDRVTISR